MPASFQLELKTPSVTDYCHLRVASGLSAKTIEAATIGLAATLFAVQITLEGQVVAMGRLPHPPDPVVDDAQVEQALDAAELEALDAAIAAVNATPAGLSASIITRDLNAAMQWVRHVEVGLARINGDTTDFGPPPSHSIKVFESKSHWVNPLVTSFAFGLVPMCFQALAKRQPLLWAFIGRKRIDNGRRRWRRRAKNLSHHPLAAQHRARSLRITCNGEQGPHTEETAALHAIRLYPSHFITSYGRHAIVLCKLIVYKCKITLDEVTYWAILAHHRGHVKRDFIKHRLTKRLCEHRVLARIRLCCL